jgi:hypothetical protein
MRTAWILAAMARVKLNNVMYIHIVTFAGAARRKDD